MDKDAFINFVKRILNIPESEKIVHDDLERLLTGQGFTIDLEDKDDLELSKKLLNYNVMLYIKHAKFNSIEDIFNLELVKHITCGEIIFENCSIGPKTTSRIGLYKDNRQTIIDIYDIDDLQFVINTIPNKDNYKFKLNMTAIRYKWEKYPKLNVVSYEELVEVYKVYNYFKNNFNNSNWNDLDKILIAGMFLSINTEYDFENSENEYKILAQKSIYGCLINGVTRCVGYASGYMFLLKSMGVECRFIGSNGHAWNQVKINNNWYNIDITNLKSFFLFGDLQHEKYALTSNKTFFYHWKECGDEEVTYNVADKRRLIMSSEDLDRQTINNHLESIRNTIGDYFHTFSTDKSTDIDNITVHK